MIIKCFFKSTILASQGWEETQLNRLKEILSTKLGSQFEEKTRDERSLTLTTERKEVS